MEDLVLESKDSKIEKLISNVNHKFNVFSISNTLFPKNKIDNSDLYKFFEIISERVDFILSAPVGVFNRVIDNQFQSDSYSVSSMQSQNLFELANNILLFLKEEEVIAFYDLTYDTNSYRIRIHKFCDDLRLCAIKRDKKIDDLLQ